MASPSQFTSDVVFQGNTTFSGTVTTQWVRSTQMAQETLVAYPIPLTSLRVHDAIQTNLPGTAATDDLGILGTAFGTSAPTVVTSDAKATTVTQYARFTCSVPDRYDAGQTIQMRIFAGMKTTVSDGTATLDLEVYEIAGDGAIGSDLCSTSATSINGSTTNSARDFTIDGSGLVAGDILDCRITIAITDSSSVTAVIGEIDYIELLCDVR